MNSATLVPSSWTGTSTSIVAGVPGSGRNSGGTASSGEYEKYWAGTVVNEVCREIHEGLLGLKVRVEL